jgi:flagellar biosynthesis GTPase FlhF
VVLVLSALHQEIIGKKMMQRYRSWIDGVAITHTDSSIGLGNLYSTIVQYDRPLFVLSTGRKIPQDWKAADPVLVVKKIFGLSDVIS